MNLLTRQRQTIDERYRLIGSASRAAGNPVESSDPGAFLWVICDMEFDVGEEYLLPAPASWVNSRVS
jgi:hypothetical protein